MSRARAWCFTSYDLEIQPLKEEDLKYLIRGKEVCPTTGRDHIQGYVVFKNAKSMSAVKKWFKEPAMHLERAKGSPKQNYEYCSKEGAFCELGELPKQGKRSDIEDVRAVIDEGGGMRDVVDVASNYQCLRTGELLLKYIERKRDWKPEVFWFYGATGTGKTREAMELCEDPWISNKNLQWWDGYDAHEDVIIDDFRGDFCTFHELLRILDRYPYQIMVKGGSRQLLAKRIFITCPYPPDKVYSTREDVEQLIRRIDVIREF